MLTGLLIFFHHLNLVDSKIYTSVALSKGSIQALYKLRNKCVLSSGFLKVQ